jgi:hypothetical protein
MGPAVLITIGVLFLLHEVRGDIFDFSNTYPFILIVIGAILLAASLAPMDGHVDSTVATPPAVPPARPCAEFTAGPGAITAHVQTSPARQQRIQRFGPDLHRIAAAVAQLPRVRSHRYCVSLVAADSDCLGRHQDL